MCGKRLSVGWGDSLIIEVVSAMSSIAIQFIDGYLLLFYSFLMLVSKWLNIVKNIDGK